MRYWKILLLGVVGVFVVAHGFAYYLSSTRVPFQMFFSEESIPQSVRKVDSGKERPFTGGGIYILVFTVPRVDVQKLTASNGFVRVDINDDPNSWRLSLCNSMISRLTTKKIEITTDFEAYSKQQTNTQNSSRFFYDTNREFGIVIGCGTFIIPNGHTRY